MLRKDTAQLSNRSVVFSQNDGGTQQGTVQADTDRRKRHQPFALVPGRERLQMTDAPHVHDMQGQIHPAQLPEIVVGDCGFQDFHAASSARKKPV